VRNLKRRSPPTRTARGSRYCVLEVDSVPRTVPSTSDRPRRRIPLGTRRPTLHSLPIPAFAVNQRFFGRHGRRVFRRLFEAPRSWSESLAPQLGIERPCCPTSTAHSLSSTAVAGSSSRPHLPATRAQVENGGCVEPSQSIQHTDQRQARPKSRSATHSPCRPASRMLSRSRTGARPAHHSDVALPRSSRSCDTVGRCETPGPRLGC